jgi:predicted chitinase
LGIGNAGTSNTKPATFPVTAEQLNKIFPGTSAARCAEVAKIVNKYSTEYGIDNAEKMSLFLGQIGAETGLNDLSENSYSASTILTAKKTRTTRLHNGKRVLKYCSLFENKNSDGTDCPYPYCNDDIVVPEGSYDNEGTIYYATIDFMKSLKLKVKSSMTDQKPDDADFFNVVYACQLDNGNIASGDGYRFRGRGFLQITGYCNYKSKVQARWDAVHGKGDKNFLCRDATCDANLEAIANDLDFSMQISLAFWKAKDVNNLANDTNDDTIRNVTIAVNGGENGLPNRKTYTKKAYEVLKK